MARTHWKRKLRHSAVIGLSLMMIVGILLVYSVDSLYQSYAEPRSPGYGTGPHLPESEGKPLSPKAVNSFPHHLEELSNQAELNKQIPTSQVHDWINLPCNTSQCVSIGRDSTTIIDNSHQVLNARIFNSLQSQLEVLQRNFTHETKYHQFMINTSLSEQLPLFRPMDGTKPKDCHSFEFSAKLPSVSVIVPFHNEAWSVLLRTLHSLISTLPLDLVREIILIDDKSTFRNCQDALVAYLSQIPKIVLIRTKVREGLIRARMLGAKRALGDVLVFVDAHMEFGDQWLEPLLAKVASNPRTVVVPTVHYINPQSLEITPYNERFSYGIFTWELDFAWMDITGIPKETADPFDTMTMIGCASVVNRLNFLASGGFDEGMLIWGGENLELSFKTWMCGGSVKIVPCSEVAHIFRTYLPYTFPITDAIYKNLQRVALTWMDEYARYYFLTTGKIMNMNQEEKNSIHQRIALRKELGCQNFSWYLSQKSSDLFNIDDDALLFGQIKNVATTGWSAGYCLSAAEMNSSSLEFQPCSTHVSDQVFKFSNKLLVSISTKRCIALMATREGLPIVGLDLCNVVDRLQAWSYDPIVPEHVEHKLTGVDIRKPVGVFRLFHGNFNNCLMMSIVRNSPVLVVEKCNHNNPMQYWIFTHKIFSHLRPKIENLMHEFRLTHMDQI